MISNCESLIPIESVVSEFQQTDAADGNLWRNDEKKGLIEWRGTRLQCIILHFNSLSGFQYSRIKLNGAS